MYKKTYKPFKAKTVKEKSTENIKEFSNKILYTLEKARSPHTIVFIEDDIDPWFVFVKTFKTKSGIITDSNMIIGSDVESWISHLQHVGWTLKK